jgi:hypothetical protein
MREAIYNKLSKEMKMVQADLKTIKITGALYWSRWMGEFNTAFNSDNDRYECTIGNISDDDAAKLTGLGIRVKHKEAMGNFIVAKSLHLFKPLDDNMKEVDVKTLGNGSKCIAMLTAYTHKMSAKYGNSPSIKKLFVTEVVTYTPPVTVEEDDDAL